MKGNSGIGEEGVKKLMKKDWPMLRQIILGK